MTTRGPISSSRVAIIGTGFGGLGMAYYLKQMGIHDITLFEKGADVGGTWRENTYPGAGCDVPSHLYSFSFEPHYPWAWRYARQPEILAYSRHCARKYDLLRHVQFNSAVAGASFDAARRVWTLTLADGRQHEAPVLVSAVGQLHRPAFPKITGLDRFAGRAFHSAEWDHGFDLRGKRVAVIGSGASAVQFVPEVAKQASQLFLYQRTPGWILPKVEKSFAPWEQWLLKQLPTLHDLDRSRIYNLLDLLAMGFEGNAVIAKAIELVARNQLRRQVRDPVLRRRLTPDYPVGCKRVLLSNDWLPALTRPNVEVVTEAIREVTAQGVRTADGREREVDALIYGTGFSATDFLAPMDIRNGEGQSLREQWKQGAEAYLGMAVHGFPNLFMLYGPNTNVGSGSIITMLEAQQRYIVSLLGQQQAQGWPQIEVTAAAQAEYVAEVQRRSAETTFQGNCQSWYKTADGRNTNNWIGTMREFERRTREPVLSHFGTATAAA